MHARESLLLRDAITLQDRESLLLQGAIIYMTANPFYFPMLLLYDRESLYIMMQLLYVHDRESLYFMLLLHMPANPFTSWLYGFT